MAMAGPISLVSARAKSCCVLWNPTEIHRALTCERWQARIHRFVSTTKGSGSLAHSSAQCNLRHQLVRLRLQMLPAERFIGSLQNQLQQANEHGQDCVTVGNARESLVF